MSFELSLKRTLILTVRIEIQPRCQGQIGEQVIFAWKTEYMMGEEYVLRLKR